MKYCVSGNRFYVGQEDYKGDLLYGPRQMICNAKTFLLDKSINIKSGVYSLEEFCRIVSNVETLEVRCRELEKQVKAQGSQSYLEVQKTCSALYRKEADVKKQILTLLEKF